MHELLDIIANMFNYWPMGKPKRQDKYVRKHDLRGMPYRGIPKIMADEQGSSQSNTSHQPNQPNPSKPAKPSE